MSENRSRFAVLGALSLGPMAGYDVRAFFEEGVSHFWRESYGQIYPMLKDLARDGLAVPRAGRNGARRTVYEITSAGRSALATWLRQPAEDQPVRLEILLKLFFASEGDRGTAMRLLVEFRDRHKARLALYEEIKRTTTRNYPEHPNLANWLVTLSYGAHVSRALLAWCDESLKTLEPASRTKRPRRRAPRGKPRKS